MRLLIDSLMAVMLAALLAGILLNQRQEAEFQRDLNTARISVRMIQQQVTFQAALGQTPRNEYGFPTTIDPMWFKEALPRNPMLHGEGPWLEVAGNDERLLMHPRVRTCENSKMAMFWYNPTTGVVRARVPHMVSDEKTLEMYNFINGSQLSDLFAATPPVSSSHTSPSVQSPPVSIPATILASAQR